LVKNDEGLSIRLKGIVGKPIMSGISVRKGLSASKFYFYHGAA